MKRRRPARARGGVYTRPDSPNYWLSYTVGGKRIQENTRIAIAQPGMTETATKQRAQDLLLTKQSTALTTPSISDSRNLKVSDLAERLIADYQWPKVSRAYRDALAETSAAVLRKPESVPSQRGTGHGLQNEALD
jgi:hypothetical protein